MVGNPPDAPLLAPAIRRVTARTGRAPRAVAADRGDGEARVEEELVDLGVARIAIPRRGRAGPARQEVERRRGFRRLVKWRTGCEGGSAASSTALAGTAPGWTASTAPASGAATACSPTTWSGRRAAGSQAQQGSMNTRARGQATTITQPEADRLIAKSSSGPSNLTASSHRLRRVPPTADQKPLEPPGGTSVTAVDSGRPPGPAAWPRCGQDQRHARADRPRRAGLVAAGDRPHLPARGTADAIEHLASGRAGGKVVITV
jgi:hypothetical protein